MKYLLSIVLLGSVLVGAWLYVRTPAKPMNALRQSETEWRQVFDTRGADAYAAFIEVGNKLGYYDAHALAHTIGEILYEREGVSGISLCTGDFGFGCYHGFAGAALMHDGLPVVKQLDAACTHATNYLGCSHGIGHGILVYLGVNDLVKALDACPSPDDRIGGCWGGVFMEYNANTMGDQVARAYTDAHMYAPCTSVPARYRDACFYEISSWWTGTMSHEESDLKKYSIVGERCAKADSAYRDMCYRGVGNAIGPASSYDPVVMKQWCDAMPKEGRYTCLHEALGHALQSDAAMQKLRAACDDGVITDADYCKKDLQRVRF